MAATNVFGLRAATDVFFIDHIRRPLPPFARWMGAGSWKIRDVEALDAKIGKSGRWDLSNCAIYRYVTDLSMSSQWHVPKYHTLSDNPRPKPRSQSTNG